jgi:hypothetical protein
MTDETVRWAVYNIKRDEVASSRNGMSEEKAKETATRWNNIEGLSGMYEARVMKGK